MITVWVAGKQAKDGVTWSIWEVFTSRENAVEWCIDVNDFYGSIEVDKPIDPDQKKWSSCEYPLRSKDFTPAVPNK